MRECHLCTEVSTLRPYIGNGKLLLPKPDGWVTCWSCKGTGKHKQPLSPPEWDLDAMIKKEMLFS